MKRFACAALFAVISFTFVGCGFDIPPKSSEKTSTPAVTPVTVTGMVESSYKAVVKPESQDIAIQIGITLLGIEGKPATTMKLRDDAGVIHLATFGLTDDFKPGCKIEVTYDSSRSFSHAWETRPTTNPDGSKSLGLVDESYYEILSYRILNDSNIPKKK